MTQLINNIPAPSVHSAAAPSSKTEAANNNNNNKTNKQTKAKKSSKRVSWSSQLTSFRLITLELEVKVMSFRPFPILEEEESEVINTEGVNHLL